MKLARLGLRSFAPHLLLAHIGQESRRRHEKLFFWSWMLEVTGLVRCLGVTIWAATVVQSGPIHPTLAWVVRHVALLLTQFQVKSSGTTARHSPYGREHSDGIGLFAGTMFYKFHGTHGKLLPLWEEGVYVGVSELTGEHFICDERGAHAARTIRRHVPSGRCCGDKSGG